MATVLVVEDYPAHMRVWVDILSGAGFSVEEATTVAEARARLVEGSYDLAVIDPRLPLDDPSDTPRPEHGIMLCEELEECADAPNVIIVTVVPDADVAERLSRLRVVKEYLAKPVSDRALIAAAMRLTKGERRAGE